MSDLQDGAGIGRHKATFGQAMVAVFWSFFGVRKRSDHDRETASLKPLHVVIAGLVGAAIFVLVLILIVRSVVR